MTSELRRHFIVQKSPVNEKTHKLGMTYFSNYTVFAWL